MQFGKERPRKRWKLEEAEEKKVKEPAAAEAAADEPKAETPEATGEAGEAGERPDGQAAEQEKSSSAKATEDKPAEPDWKDLYARLLADFDNFKKRTARDREDTYRYAEADIIKDILPAIDNLSIALSSAKDAEDPFVKGVRLVYDTFLSSLKDHGAEPFDSVGKDLDTETMEAIAHLPSEDVAEGKVSNEAKRGWMLKGKVLRAAQVVVSAGKPAGKEVAGD